VKGWDMNKTDLLRPVNILLLISAAIEVMTGLALFFHLFISNGNIFEAIGDVHKYNGLVFVILAAAHIFLNWGWMKTQFFSKNRQSS